MGRLGKYGDLLNQAQEREDTARETFNKYDADGSGTIDLEEMRFVLADLGKLEGIPAGQVGHFLEVEFRKADTDGNGVLSFEEFTNYYNAIERLKDVCNASGGTLNDLRGVFIAFCNFGGGGGGLDVMDGPKWAKFCRETGLQNKKTFTSVQVDIVFSKVKTKGERKISFDEFKDAIAMVAELKGMTFDFLCNVVKEKGAPQSSGTKADAVKFHDDKSLFTGAHAANLGGQARSRSKADPNWKATRSPAKPTPGLEKAFEAFCTFGGGKAGSMEGKTFSKMMKDCGLYDKKFTATSADITFSKAKPKGERRISLKDFCFALDLVAEEKGMSYDDLVSAIASSEGPASSGTKADAVKFHDDKSMYTGAHNANLGGSAKIRERKDWRDGRELPQDVPGLEQTFNAFCTFGGGQAGAMDNAKFAKLCADSGLINKKFTSTDADIIFSKVKPKGERRISYMDFLWTVDLMAESKQTSYGNIANSMLNGGPASSGTKADAVRFHDDKSQYTVEGGARAETPA